MVQIPPYIFGMHDRGGESLMLGAGKPGWVVVTAKVSDPPGDYSDLANAGLGVIVRLNYGYGSEGTIPLSSQYDEFARACASFVANSRGANIWIIGNETNRRSERPGNSDSNPGEVITPEKYARCFAACRAAIKQTPGHADDWIAPAPPGPWNTETTYAGNSNGDWVKYFQDILNQCIQLGAPPDALALHTYTHGFDAGLVASEEMMPPAFPNRHYHLRAYRDFLGVVPESLRLLPVLITETQPADPDWWQNYDRGWIQAAYAEINAWNSATANQPIQALCLFRWERGDARWSIAEKNALHDDFRAALRNEYRVRMPQPTSALSITNVAFAPTTLIAGQLLNVSITVKNTGNVTLPTQGPNPGFVYEEGDTFRTRGFSEIGGNYRVGVDFDNRAGVDHPYRWGLGAPLAPGETRTITGAIHVKTPRTQNYWAGLVQEQVAWLQDRQGVQAITVGAGVQITNVTFTPTSLNAGQYLTVNITVRNDSGIALPTQGPDPGFFYEEGDTFATRGFPDIGGNYRVGVDFDNRTGVDHPYRWGFGAPLAPGETRTISGAIHVKTPRTQNYWAGLVQEQVAWIQDRQGVQAITVRSGPQITNVTFVPTALKSGESIQVSITVRNDSDTLLPTQGPDPGFVYTEGDTFATRGFPDIGGNWRVGVDFDNRAGVDHPYRWGFGTPLAPGETRTITGKIVLTSPQSRNYWAGLVQERVAWIADRQGVQTITVTPAPRLTNVAFAPTSVEVGQSLNVSITVRNDGAAPLPTQGPDPGFVYEEADTFATRGFPAIAGNLRVGVDFDNRTGVDHPYRWGLGAPLAPGETRTIAGAIRMRNPQSQKYWAGLVQEYVAWLQDREGEQVIQVRQPGLRPRVVHTHSANATAWNGEADYWNYVHQNVVNDMVERGLMQLTGAATLAEAWRAILPRYQPGQGIAVKVNMTNGGDGKLDALYQTVNAVARGLTQIGVRERDIWVFDATDNIPSHFAQGCQYPGIVFYDQGAHNRATFDSSDPTARITFSPPAGVQPLPQIKVTDVLVNATYVINIPILKGHFTGAGVTLAFKNHLGSTNNAVAFHPYIFPGGAYFRSDYNPLVDLYRNPNIGAKTVLTIGEGLFAGTTWDSMPLPMRTFGNKPPNSLFFATDPVALDCVLYDLLAAEWSVPVGADYYLPLASRAGLGVFEHGDPWGAGYAGIEYWQVEVGQ